MPNRPPRGGGPEGGSHRGPSAEATQLVCSALARPWIHGAVWTGAAGRKPTSLWPQAWGGRAKWKQ